MQFIDLGAQQKRIRKQIERNISNILDHGKYIMGPEVARLEDELKAFVGARHAIACASGTDALLLALLAEDVGPGDAIFTSPFTFIATAEVISLVGATPVFVDIDEKTYNIDPQRLESAIGALEAADSGRHPLPSGDSSLSELKPRGIIAVDLFGLPADYARINDVARRHGMFVIEDAAQSFGAEADGQKACRMADMACTSFFPAKPLGAYGDGGMCFTDSDRLAEAMQSLRVHGKGHHKYDNVRIGINGRLDTIQAAILLAKFEIFPEEIELRQQVAQNYTKRLISHPSMVTPETPAGYKSAWAQYSILARDEAHRSELQDRLKQHGIPTAIYYPKPLHLQTAFACLGYRAGDFPYSEDYALRIFSLPMHPYLTEDEQDNIASILEN
ncbi:MAG: DegT/DnrJ/EryC1/StrS aminotransferase family protein [Deltaproteobacteria bacterium]|nr:DegT/DnrJ/EryC1/StrS aminotransferase family protein [Deltaproteobacteria bacterium]